jgi:HK97 gp10 family phage protein
MSIPTPLNCFLGDVMADDSDDLQNYLNNLPDKLRERVNQTLLEQAAKLSLAQRQALQSLEETEPTGDLEESCTVVPGDNDGEVIVQAGGPLTTKEVREGSGVSYDYAEAFEFGTSRQPARPFFYNTYDAMKGEILDSVNDAVSEELK